MNSRQKIYLVELFSYNMGFSIFDIGVEERTELLKRLESCNTSEEIYAEVLAIRRDDNLWYDEDLKFRTKLLQEI